jgi:hypothetical protein
MTDDYNLQRFLEAQDHGYDAVLDELRAGRKSSHWMWYIFPQIKGLGHSGAPRPYPSSVADYCGGRQPWSLLCLRRNPPKRVPLRQGFGTPPRGSGRRVGGNPLRIPPQLYNCGFLRRRMERHRHSPLPLSMSPRPTCNTLFLGSEPARSLFSTWAGAALNRYSAIRTI